MKPRQVGIIDEETVKLLGLSIAAGTPILLGESNLKHMQESHPDSYEKYFSHLEDILAAPDYINLNPKDGSIKYIKTIDEHVVVGSAFPPKETLSPEQSSPLRNGSSSSMLMVAT